jgi:atypical dual specificity phosphatase
MSEIIKGKLYLGDIDDANDLDFIRSTGINVIVTTAGSCIITDEVKNEVEHYQFKIKDTSTFNIRDFFPEVCAIIEKAITEDKCVLVHCWAGISRSPCCTIAYLMMYKNKTYLEAWRMVFEQRDMVHMNDGFIQQLGDLELELYGENSC